MLMYTLLRTDCRVLIKISHGLVMIVETDELRNSSFFDGDFPFLSFRKVKNNSNRSRSLSRGQPLLTCINTTHVLQSTGLEVNFLVHLQSFARKIFFHQQTGETTSKFFPFVWETWMIPTRKRLLVDVFLTCRLSKSIACCEFASVNFLALVQGAFHLSELTGQTIRALMRNSLLIITIQLDQLNFKQQA